MASLTLATEGIVLDGDSAAMGRPDGAVRTHAISTKSTTGLGKSRPGMYDLQFPAIIGIKDLAGGVSLPSLIWAAH